MDPLDPALSYYSLEQHDQADQPDIDLSAYDSLAHTSLHNFDSRKNGESSKKRKSEGEDGKSKKTRQSQSCDACRARKVRCDRPPPGTLGPESDMPTKDRCSHCQHLKLPCTFDYVPKKRGPPNQYVKKLKAGDPGSVSDTSPPQLRPPSDPSTGTYNPGSASSAPYVTTTEYYTSGYPSEQGGPGPGTLAEQRAIHATALTDQGSALNPIGRINGRDVEADWEPSLLRAIEATAPTHPQPQLHPQPHLQTSITQQQQQQQQQISPLPRVPSSQGFSPNYAISPSYPKFPHNPNNPFDNILPRGLLYHTIDLFFDYIYCLTPCLHRPSFMRDLHAMKEERPDEDEWIALVMAVVALTLLQIPRSFVPLPRSEVKILAEKCSLMARTFLNKHFTVITTNRFIILYLSEYTAVLLGFRELAACLAGSNWALMLRANLHEEETYATLNPVDSELRRRMFWLQFGAEKSIEVLENSPSFVSDTLCAGVNLPSQIDDELITENGYLEQKDTKEPILCGFYYTSKLYRITGQLLDKRLRDRARPPTGLMLQMRVNEINALYDQVMSLMDDCPPSLRLDLDAEDRSTSGFSDDWDTHASNDVRKIILDPKASKVVVKDVFLIQQANIYVTQQMVRYVALQYRDDLLTLQQKEESARQGETRSQSRTRRQPSQTAAQRRMSWSRALFADEEKEQVASDLLVILQKIPIQIIAVNSFPFVLKVRFVASTLLDALNADGEDAEPKGRVTEVSRVKRAQQYLWDFLRILSEIEALYSMEEEDTSPR